MRGVVVESFVVGLLLLTAACVSSATADSGGTTGGMVGGGADGSLNGSPPPAGADARPPTGAADPSTCASFTALSSQATRDTRALSESAHQARGPLSLLISALVIEAADDDGRSAADIATAVRTVCGDQAANTTDVEICEALDQAWLSAADETVAAQNDATARAAAIHKLADQARTDIAPLQQDGDDHAAKLADAVRGIKAGSTAQSAIAVATSCAGLDDVPPAVTGTTAPARQPTSSAET